MNVHYQLTGSLEVPDGSRLSDAETAIILPDGSVIKLWEAWERHLPAEDTYSTLTHDGMCALGIFDDTLTREFDEH
ncbi:hypothetical protein [Sphingobium subterraneum]|uniref:Uncharacterized protein n=1 Tax=Sphingobium subterraneum TaxID=627688 RepID=A0A841JAP2_9SPHN|nr:hypothetical protein [Sphingobium subterraneum]MBB6125648.1 hypothetical protein [Sphingobium subterraneum]